MKFRILLALIVFQWAFSGLWAQVYQFRPAVDGTYLGGMAVGYGLLKWQMEKIPPLSQAGIAALDPATIPGIDRSATRYWSPGVARASDIVVGGAIAMPFVALAHKKVRSEWLTLGVMGAEAGLTTLGLAEMSKSLVKRPRPFVYNPAAPLSEKEKPGARFSWFSGHTSLTGCFSFFSAKVFGDMFPDSRAKPWVWAGAAALPAGVAFLRYRAGKHFPTDVVTGYAVGAFTGWIIPHLHKKKSQANLSFYPLGPGNQGVGMIYRF
ncbi:MAG: phosphatase PAP2 family protein [Bacteroidia bacterium]|nr:phosphatase PAP2 family protein [Bacteroidia bacterium]